MQCRSFSSSNGRIFFEFSEFLFHYINPDSLSLSLNLNIFQFLQKKNSLSLSLKKQQFCFSHSNSLYEIWFFMWSERISNSLKGRVFMTLKFSVSTRLSLSRYNYTICSQRESVFNILWFYNYTISTRSKGECSWHLKLWLSPSLLLHHHYSIVLSVLIIF